MAGGVQFVTRRIEPDILVVRLVGSLIPGSEAHALESLIQSLMDHEKKVIFDLGGIERIDSTGIQFLMQSFFTLRQAGGGLRLAGPSRITRLFTFLRLDSLGSIYPTVASAAADFEVTKGT